MLDVTGLISQYGRIKALKGVDVKIDEGELVALVGGNGAGKTTLLKAISGVQPISGGSIKFLGEDITRHDPSRRVRLGIAQVPEGRQVFAPLAVEDNLLLGGFTRRRTDLERDLARVYEMFPVLKERARGAAGNLSGGEQQMLAIGRALMARPKLLLLDEPSMGLAPMLVEKILAAIQSLKTSGTTVFLVEQNANAALAIADRGYVIETGRIVLGDSGQALLGNAEVRASYLGI